MRFPCALYLTFFPYLSNHHSSFLLDFNPNFNISNHSILTEEPDKSDTDGRRPLKVI